MFAPVQCAKTLDIMKGTYGSSLDDADKDWERPRLEVFVSMITRARLGFIPSLDGFDNWFEAWLVRAAKSADYKPDLLLAFLECGRRHLRGHHELCHAWRLHEVEQAEGPYNFEDDFDLCPAALKLIDAVLECVAMEREEFLQDGHTCDAEEVDGTLAPCGSLARGPGSSVRAPLCATAPQRSGVPKRPTSLPRCMRSTWIGR